MDFADEIEGNFPLHLAVVEAMPEGTKVLAAESCGISAWTKTAKVTIMTPENEQKRLFLKCVTGKGARALAEGEYHSILAMKEAAPGLVPDAVGWGTYDVDGEEHFFYLGEYRDMDLTTTPDPMAFATRVAEFHTNGKSPTGKFGFAVPTTIGIMERTVIWEDNWAKSFTRQLQDVIGYDNDTNGTWPELEAASDHLIESVIPRLLGALQSEGRTIEPALVHGDLWEQNVGTDMETGEIIIFDPGCTYAHNEMEFGTWRCSWAFNFNSPIYMRMYQRLVEPSEPVDEWDDRNRLYSIFPYLVDSAGHPGSQSRKLAYNDMLYLCEKYAPLDGLEKYDPEKDISVTGNYTTFVMTQLQ